MTNFQLDAVEAQIIPNREEQYIGIDSELLRMMIDALKREHDPADAIERLKAQVEDLEVELEASWENL